MKKSVYYLVCIYFLLHALSSFSQESENTYHTKNRLFHIERSKNKNIICYDVNLDESGALDKKKPLNVYWVNREEEPGKTNGLSAIQKKLAYGYKLISSSDEMCLISVKAYPERLIKIQKQDGKFVARILINGIADAVLTKIYVKSKESNSLSVDYVELTGIDNNGNLISEQINNNQ